MATDWTSPKTSDTHTNELAATRGRDESNARMDYTGDTNIPDGTIRWNKTNNRFEIWNATTSTWSVLSSKYMINVDTVDGYHAGNASGNVPVSNGTVNTNLNADKLDGQHGTFFQARENHTGTQAPSTISPQGTGSGLNADLLDGLHSSAFLGVSAKAVDSDKLDGLDSSNFNRVIDLTGQVQTTSYRKSVIALCNLDNTEIQRNSWSMGRITFHRFNGLTPDLSVLYSASKKYNTTSMNWAAIISNASDDGPGIQPCTFTYNGVKYGGIHFYYHPASNDRIVWEGNQTVEGSFEPFGLDYYDTQNNIALNTEVNGSLVIDGADIVKSTRAEFNNNLLWHAGNDGAGSGLDADLLDGKHLSEIGGGEQWEVFPIGVPIQVWDHLSSSVVPPNSGDVIYVRLTAGQSALGGYNYGNLSSESVTGSAPLVVATAVISLSTSPLYNTTIHLINTEEAFIRARTVSGELQNDQMQQLTGQFGRVMEEVTASGVFERGDGAQMRIDGYDVYYLATVSFDSSRVARSGNETRSKNVSATWYLRIR